MLPYARSLPASDSTFRYLTSGSDSVARTFSSLLGRANNHWASSLIVGEEADMLGGLRGPRRTF